MRRVHSVRLWLVVAAVGCLPWGRAKTEGDPSSDDCSLQVWFLDADGDDVGTDSETRSACETPDGYAAVSGDCDDGDSETHPGADETCDGKDNDCDDSIDDDDSDVHDAALWYEDGDGDGFGKAGSGTQRCTCPAGHVSESGDCDDDDGAVNPGVAEVCANGKDDNCDGTACPWPAEVDFTDSDVTLYGTRDAEGDDCLEEDVWWWTDRWFGASLTSAGDVDGDGSDDIMVGAPYAEYGEKYNDRGDCNSWTAEKEGRAYLFTDLGSYDSKYSSSAKGEFNQHGMAICCEDANATLAWRMDGAGNLCGASGAGFIFTAPGSGGSDTNGGAVLKCLDSDGTSIGTKIYDGRTDYLLGEGVRVTDLDADGEDEVILSAPGADAIYVFNDTYDGYYYEDDDAVLTIKDDSDAWSNFGCCEDGIVPFDAMGNGNQDLAIGAPEASSSGRIYVFTGPLDLYEGASLSTEDANWSIAGAQAGMSFGTSISKWMGPSGVDQLVVGADLYDGESEVSVGAVYLLRPLEGIDPTVTTDDSDLVQATILGSDNNDKLGYPLTADGDFNGDGDADLVISARYAESSSSSEGQGMVYVLYGPLSNLSGTYRVEDIDDKSVFFGPTGGALGDGLAVLDADGDGIDDLAMGAHGDADEDYGQAFIFFGQGF